MKHNKIYVLVLAVLSLGIISNLIPAKTSAGSPPQGVSGNYTSSSQYIQIGSTTYEQCTVDNSCNLIVGLAENTTGGQKTQIADDSNLIYWPTTNTNGTLTPVIESQSITCPGNTPFNNYFNKPAVDDTFIDLQGSQNSTPTLDTFVDQYNYSRHLQSGKGSLTETYIECVNNDSYGVPLTLTNTPPSLPTVTGTFINAGSIVLTDGQDANQEFTDNNPTDQNHDFFENGDSSASGGVCADLVAPSPITNNSKPPFYLWQDKTTGNSGACDSYGDYIQVAVTQLNDTNAHEWFQWTDANDILNVANKQDYKVLPNGQFQCQSAGGNPSTITINGPDNPNSNVQGSYQGTGCTAPNSYGLNNDSFTILAQSPDGPQNTNTDSNSGAGSGSGNNTSDAPTCESGGGDLSWILCPIINGLASAIDGIYSNVIQPLLITAPVNFTDPSNDPTHTFEIWSNFRIYGDVFLIIALLVVVFGESIGGGLIDAYTAKKVLPRLLIAAVLINLSIYFIALAVDITNIIGGGLIALIEEPFKNAGAFKLTLNAGSSGIGLAALIGGSIWGAISIIPLMEFLLTFFLVPAFLTFIAILVTVLIRRGLIIFLILVSPIAFALYCLPNTEQYFKKWFDLLLKTLLVYPIIALIFGIADVLSVTIDSASTTGGISATIGGLLSIIALIVPLVMIPFAFRLAGGALGKLHETLTDYGKRGHEFYKGNINDENSRQNRARRHLTERNLRNRERGVASFNALQTRNTGAFDPNAKGKKGARRGRGLVRSLGNIGARSLNYGDLEGQRAAINKREHDLSELKAANAPDSSLRALWAKQEEDGTWVSPISGEHFTGSQVAAARRLSGNGKSSVEGAVGYELTKVGNATEYESFLQRIPQRLTQLGFKDEEVKEVMKAVGYKQASKYLDLKHSSWDHDGKGNWTRSINYTKMSNDAAENFQSYPFSNLKAVTVSSAAKGHELADNVIQADKSGALGRMSAEDQQAFLKENGGFGDTAESAVLNATKARDNFENSAVALDSRRQMGGGAFQDSDGNQIGGQLATGAAGNADVEIQNFVNNVNARKERDGEARPQPVRRGGSSGGGPDFS